MLLRTGEVRFDYMNRAFLFDAGDAEAQPGDVLVVETDFGLDMGLLVDEMKEVEVDETLLPLKKILRKATDEDIEKRETLGAKEEQAHNICLEEIEKANLGMKLVSARYSFDGSRVSFCYTADGRVDFRELVRTLASRLRTRIELRQVGVRDEARLFGGFGPCGRRLCCAAFLTEFKSVSIKMAKEQGLPLNPMKISGICGRLFCCLKYEYDEYMRIRQYLPEQGDTFTYNDVKGRVFNVNVLKHTVTLQTEGGGYVDVVIDVPEPEPGCACGHNSCHKDEEAAPDIPVEKLIESEK